MNQGPVTLEWFQFPVNKEQALLGLTTPRLVTRGPSATSLQFVPRRQSKFCCLFSSNGTKKDQELSLDMLICGTFSRPALAAFTWEGFYLRVLKQVGSKRERLASQRDAHFICFPQ